MAHEWTESDDIAALYLAVHGEGLYACDVVAKRLGIGPDAMRMRMANFLALKKGSGLSHASAQSRDVWRRHRSTPREELERLLDQHIQGAAAVVAGPFQPPSREATAIATGLFEALKARISARAPDYGHIVGLGRSRAEAVRGWSWCELMIVLAEAMRTRSLDLGALHVMLARDDEDLLASTKTGGPGRFSLGVVFDHLTTSDEAAACAEPLRRRLASYLTNESFQVPFPDFYCGLAVVTGTHESFDVSQHMNVLRDRLSYVSEPMTVRVCDEVQIGAERRRVAAVGVCLVVGDSAHRRAQA